MLEDYKAFVLFCKEQGVLSAQMGEFLVSFEPGFDFQELEAEEEEEDNEDPLFYSVES